MKNTEFLIVENHYRNTKAYELFLDELKSINGKLKVVICNFENSKDLIEEFKTSAHKLKGCAELFNYPELGEKANVIEKKDEDLLLSEIVKLHQEVMEIISKL